MLGLTATQWLQFAFLLLKGANWAMSKVDQQTWKNEGRKEVILEQAKVLYDWIDTANAIREETSKMTDDQITDDLDKNGELRKD